MPGWNGISNIDSEHWISSMCLFSEAKWIQKSALTIPRYLISYRDEPLSAEHLSLILCIT